jgi:hypothetical protein
MGKTKEMMTFLYVLEIIWYGFGFDWRNLMLSFITDAINLGIGFLIARSVL